MKVHDRVLAVEKSVITEVEREKLTLNVVTKRELGELAQKQDATKREIEERVGGLTAQQDTAKAELDKRMGGLEKKQDVTSSSLEKLHHHVHIVPVQPIAPVRIVFSNFEQHMKDKDNWYSEGFYTHPQGYKLCLYVVANGNQSGEGTHVTCGIHLMRGEFDDRLKWPFQGDIAIQLLNQQKDSNHRTWTFDFLDTEEQSARLTNEERAAKGWGYQQFIAHSELGHNAVTNCQYLVNDCLFFRVKVELK